MIQEFVDAFMAKKDKLIHVFQEKHPDEYIDIVKAVVSVLSEAASVELPSPEKIHEIGYENYQGTLVFVIGSEESSSDYWYVKIEYGSCSACDTLQGIRDYTEDKPTEEQVDDYMTLALHIVQAMKKMSGDAV